MSWSIAEQRSPALLRACIPLVGCCGFRAPSCAGCCRAAVSVPAALPLLLLCLPCLCLLLLWVAQLAPRLHLLPELLVSTHVLWLCTQNWGLWVLPSAGSVVAALGSHQHAKVWEGRVWVSFLLWDTSSPPCKSCDSKAGGLSVPPTSEREEAAPHHLGFCILAGCPALWLHAYGLHWCAVRDGLQHLCVAIRNERTPKWGDGVAVALQLPLLVEL